MHAMQQDLSLVHFSLAQGFLLLSFNGLLKIEVLRGSFA